ncbi:putative protein phosphatase 2C [Leptomonas pyrrhocoris]|uniref:protein-serine/threonine phosphatase n=1 Tax=Leptomonas pyrrhocoris TaxID=157538 RepID=A0A0N0DQX0_LEPPY|nr:putative protein phosphatase 2C [Leptomonas pyrrhocoris]XP_015651721.1 putative protein phosphatase 2C [Leptomonas pyrrhocoris]KPA73281.1 putative protein phosphatase 2C [Leptomonas pyrrhocoris]KPA73282.1 putative protein phosphatase 2C [Leptomonas pyrrhocoris]|eukprot:XP_015651720.1 putative protein phosphatase 2C [Leptomonas pyrrhocoris]
MPPKAKNASKHNGHVNNKTKGKSKKQVEEDDFEKFLSTLAKSTEHVGKERTEKEAREAKLRDEHRKKHADLTDQRKSNDVEKALLNRQKNMQLQRLLSELLAAQRPFNTTPVTDFHSETITSNPHFDVAVGEMQGWRAQMEDAHLINVAFPGGDEQGREGLFGVFDGHSGAQCAKLAGDFFTTALAKHASADGDDHHNINYEAAFLEVDEQLRTALGEGGSGCTAVLVYVSPQEITCAWVGDSRAVLCRDIASFDLSYDHKPDVEVEKTRVEDAGGFVRDNRVNGQLAMSRAMGDFVYKKDATRDVKQQLVVAVPGVITTKRGGGDSYVVIACDGIFDVLSNDELISFINGKKADGMENVDICKAVCDRCLAGAAPEGGPATAEGTDNMTLMIVDFK